MGKLVAVYGTLKAECGNHHVTEMCNPTYVGTTRTVEKFDMIDGWGFPRVVHHEGEKEGHTHITVEVYSVEDIDPMDRLEGHPDFFRRRRVKVEGLDELVWMYFHPPVHEQDPELHETGNWSPYDFKTDYHDLYD